MHIDACLSGHCVAEILMWETAHKLMSQFFYTWYDTIDVYHFYEISWPWSWPRARGSVNSETCLVHFLMQFSMIQSKSDIETSESEISFAILVCKMCIVGK